MVGHIEDPTELRLSKTRRLYDQGPGRTATSPPTGKDECSSPLPGYPFFTLFLIFMILSDYPAIHGTRFRSPPRMGIFFQVFSSFFQVLFYHLSV